MVRRIGRMILIMLLSALFLVSVVSASETYITRLISGVNLGQGNMSTATFYDATGGDTITTTAETIEFDSTLTNSDATMFGMENDVNLTVSDNGFYDIDVKVGARLGSGTRSGLTIYLQHWNGSSWNTIGGTNSFGYGRLTAEQHYSPMISISYEILSGEKLRVIADTQTTSVVTIASASSIEITRLSGARGLQGIQGIQGLNGTDGIDGANATYWNRTGDDIYTRQLNYSVGIGTDNPAYPLHVQGVTRINGNLDMRETATNRLLFLEGANDPTKPQVTLSSTGSGFYAQTASIPAVSVGGAQRWRWASTYFISTEPDGAGIDGTVCSATNPTVWGDRTDQDSGLGCVDDADTPVIVAGGVTGLAVKESAGVITVGVNTVAPDYTLDVAGSLSIDGTMFHNGDANTYLQFFPDQLFLRAGGITGIDITEGATDIVTINPDNANMSFAVDSLAGNNEFYVDGENGYVMVGGNTPTNIMTIREDALGTSNTLLRLENLAGNDNNTGGRITFVSSTSGSPKETGAIVSAFDTDNTQSYMIFRTRSGGVTDETVRISKDGYLGIGTTTPDYELDVSGDIGINAYQFHNGDSNNYEVYNTDQFRRNVGGEWMINASEGATDFLQLGNGGGNVDVLLNNDVYVDGGTGYVGIATQNPNATLHVIGDLNQTNGNATINMIYGELYGVDIGLINMSASGTYYNVTNTTEGLNNGFTHSKGVLTTAISGVYKIDAQWSFSGFPSTEYHLSLKLNNVQNDKCHAERKIGSGGDVGSASFTCLLELEAGDEVITAIENVNNANDPTIHNLQLNLVRIGDI